MKTGSGRKNVRKAADFEVLQKASGQMPLPKQFEAIQRCAELHRGMNLFLYPNYCIEPG